MEGVKDLLPRHKHDTERVEMISKMSRDKIVQLLPGLLEWIQDINWPVAPSVLKILLTFPEEIVPHVQDVLYSDDDNWKWYILHFLVIELPAESKIQFKEYLARVVENPTQNEHGEELDEIAKEILETL
ncbi:DUF5071 domain-containing protein [Sporosarcina sp. Sa3CUA8]|uniref:DUF5071 domain-containing protein n=1 Tax=Sporosarcina gallistercoris TaxID=2762245 RepID=A0ABR8PIW9_9BACL|nr:DUF5071 domain-containing protein [Sporosarcina gallistercoris]